ncbi:hypothetical protein [Paenibacillus sp. P46E]|uniref:hypothetical protein n=1 Tax=Paenibacillus sp. P46E TaxID=1349436 RepID=UPI001C4A0778|nr:hypothetical protein [Paenibacillus sp. P46E]
MSGVFGGNEQLIGHALETAGAGYKRYQTGQIRNFDDLTADDYRCFSARFQVENLETVALSNALAVPKGCTSSQLALVWLWHRESKLYQFQV